LYRDIFVHQCYASPVPLPDTPRILDIGANIGMASLFFLARYPDARLTCFEPNPDSFELLSENVLPTSYPRACIRPECKAVSSCNGILSLTVPLQDSTAAYASVSGSGMADIATKTVEVDTIDIRRLLDQPADLVKIDIEGHEYEVLQAARLTPRVVSVLIVEFHEIQDNRPACEVVLKWLLAEGGFQGRDERRRPLTVAEFCARQGTHLATFWDAKVAAS
jgi:FkbM family methyltransferase